MNRIDGDDARFAHALRVATTAAAAEILLVAIWTFRNAPAEGALYAGALLTLLKCGPLLAVLPGLLRGSARSAVWLCFVLCAYFPFAVLAAMDQPPHRWLGLLEILVIAIAFTAGLLAARWGRRRPEPPPRIS